jgi:hypothetical protein
MLHLVEIVYSLYTTQELFHYSLPMLPMNIKNKSWIVFYVLLLAFFLLDIISYQVLERPLLYFLLCFYCVQLRNSLKFARITSALILLSFLSLLQWGQWGLSLFYALPAPLLAVHMRHMLYDSKLPYLALLLGCLLTQLLVVEGFLLHAPLQIQTIITTLVVNGLIATIMSHLY